MRFLILNLALFLLALIVLTLIISIAGTGFQFSKLFQIHKMERKKFHSTFGNKVACSSSIPITTVLQVPDDSNDLFHKLLVNISDPTACFECFPLVRKLCHRNLCSVFVCIQFLGPNLNYCSFYLSFSTTFVVPWSVRPNPLFGTLNLFQSCFGSLEILG